MADDSRPSCLLDCFQQIDSLRDLPENWDSYGAKPVKVESIIEAMMVVGELESRLLDMPRVAATPDGNVALSWESEYCARELDVEVLPDGAIRWAFTDKRLPMKDAEGESIRTKRAAVLIRFLFGEQSDGNG